MSPKSQLAGVWCGAIFMVLWIVGWGLIGGYIPPHDPLATGAEIAATYQENAVSMRIGLIITMWATAFFAPFMAVIAVQMAKIEGRFPFWSWSVLSAGAGTVLTFGFPVMFWAVTAFRPDRGADLMLLLNDLAWVPFIAMTTPFFIAPIAIAVVGLSDKSENPVFPRWFCYFNLWMDLLLMPGGFAIFFKTGPFAWNGLFAWWMPVFAFALWIFAMMYVLIKAINRQQAAINLEQAKA